MSRKAYGSLLYIPVEKLGVIGGEEDGRVYECFRPTDLG
jgi:hypothetical protein